MGAQYSRVMGSAQIGSNRKKSNERRGVNMEDPILLGILMFGFLVTSALCHNLVELLQDLDREGKDEQIAENGVRSQKTQSI